VNDARRSAAVASLRAAGCVYAEDEADLLLAEARSHDELAELVARRVSGVPLEQVVGWADLCGLRVAIDPGVFVPRRRTALLAREALSLVPRDVARPVVLDLCCGSGAVGAVLVAAMPHVELHAADIDADAVACAQRNLVGHAVHRGDLYEPLPRRLQGSVHLLVANAPYVPTDELRLLPRDVLDHEPTVALDGGADGLEVQSRVVRGARDWVMPGGHVLVETSAHQAAASVETMAAAGLVVRLVTAPDEDATVVIGRVPDVQRFL
jgi:release factor glutamine methyltransferase